MKYSHTAKTKAAEIVVSSDASIIKTAESFAVVLWDETDIKTFVRLPESLWSKNKKTGFPNAALFQLSRDVRFDQGSLWRGFCDEEIFVVPIPTHEPTIACEIRVDPDERYPVLQRPGCHFLTVSLRGAVPKPNLIPPQIIEGGYGGVLKTIESMWPTARRFIATALSRPPKGWELFGRSERFN
jgi:hypothetical protein